MLRLYNIGGRRMNERMNMQHRDDVIRGKPQYSEINLSQSQFAHEKSYRE
jgi:hypothetical protein